MKISVSCRFLRADSRPYNFEGKEGVSYSARFLDEGFVFKARITETVFKELEHVIDQLGVCELVLSSYQDRLQLQLVSFKPE